MYDPRNPIVQKSQNRPTPSLARAYQGLFDYFNHALFDGALPAVVLNFSRHAGAYGFFAPERWEHAGGKASAAAHEISINPAELKTRTPAEVASTLVHEMVHLWQHQAGHPSRTGYHNHEWANKMEAVGLMPSSTAQPGGARVGQKMSHYIVEHGRFARAFEKLMRRSDDEQLFPWLCLPEGARAKKPPQKEQGEVHVQRVRGERVGEAGPLHRVRRLRRAL